MRPIRYVLIGILLASSLGGCASADRKIDTTYMCALLERFSHLREHALGAHLADVERYLGEPSLVSRRQVTSTCVVVRYGIESQGAPGGLAAIEWFVEASMNAENERISAIAIGLTGNVTSSSDSERDNLASDPLIGACLRTAACKGLARGYERLVKLEIRFEDLPVLGDQPTVSGFKVRMQYQECYGERGARITFKSPLGPTGTLPARPESTAVEFVAKNAWQRTQ